MFLLVNRKLLFFDKNILNFKKCFLREEEKKRSRIKCNIKAFDMALFILD